MRIKTNVKAGLSLNFTKITYGTSRDRVKEITKMRIKTIARASERVTRILKVKSGVKAGKVTMQDFHFTS